MDYLDMIKRFAFNAVKTTPDIPDARLMIGSCEDLEPQPVLIPQHKIPKEVAKSLTTLNDLDNDTVTKLIDEQSLEINDFNGNTAIIGGLIGGSVS